MSLNLICKDKHKAAFKQGACRLIGIASKDEVLLVDSGWETREYQLMYDLSSCDYLQRVIPDFEENGNSVIAELMNLLGDQITRRSSAIR